MKVLQSIIYFVLFVFYRKLEEAFLQNAPSSAHSYPPLCFANGGGSARLRIKELIVFQEHLLLPSRHCEPDHKVGRGNLKYGTAQIQGRFFLLRTVPVRPPPHPNFVEPSPVSGEGGNKTRLWWAAPLSYACGVQVNT